jgi:hypothetical protein
MTVLVFLPQLINSIRYFFLDEAWTFEYRKNPTLTAWMSNQWYDYKHEKRAGGAGKLVGDRVERLKSIGFNFN